MSKTELLRLFASADAEARFLTIYDARVREWPVPCEERDVATRHGDTHVIASGLPEAPPLMLLPAFDASATVWRPNVAAFSQRYRTYAIDTICQPNKSRPIRRIVTRKEYADWLADVFDALSISRASLVGNSHGGYLALNQAALTPKRIDRIVVISPSGPRSLVRINPSFYLRMLKAMLLGLDGFFENGVPIPRTDSSWSGLMRIAMREGVAKPNPFERRGSFSARELKEIKAPTLMLVGEREVFYAAHAAIQRARLVMPRLTAEIVPDANHVAALVRPDYVNARILDFLAGPSGLTPSLTIESGDAA
jgi:pimeloyl-ACP methyl ester carboxylesterase